MTRALWTHLVKELRIEWRSLDALISMLFFSGLVVVLFSIAFDPRGAFSQQIAGGVLCVATSAAHGSRSRSGTLFRQSHREFSLCFHCPNCFSAILLHFL
ncbi:MAG: heme exporter protein CcmB [Terracidiphilus sp.]